MVGQHAGRRLGPGTHRRSIRFLLHFVAAVPFVAGAVADMAHLWRPFGDDAVIAWRSFDVFSRHAPLVGQFTQALPHGASPYDLGPIEDWLLAIPVRLDSVHGVLWGATLLCVVAVALALEAAWSVAGPLGAAVVAGAACLLALSYPAVALDPAWNPYLGAVMLLPTLATAWCVAAGDLRWMPALVGAASVAAQCHLIYAMPALLVGFGALLSAVLRAREGGIHRRRWWILGAGGAAAALWTAPLLQQLTNRPGNMAVLLFRSVGPQAGFKPALQGLAAFVRPSPLWWHVVQPPGSGGATLAGFYQVVLRPSFAAGVVALVIVAGVFLEALLLGQRLVSSAALVSLLAALGTTWSIAQLPADQLPRLAYLDVIWWPVGMAVWTTLACSTIAVVVATTRRWWRSGRHAGARVRSSLGPALVPVAIGAVLLGLAGDAVAGAASSATSNPYRTEALRLTSELAPLAVRVAPRGEPFTLSFDGHLPPAIVASSLVEGVAYRLHVDGLDVHFRLGWRQIGSRVRPVPGSETLVLRTRPGGALSATTCASGARCHTLRADPGRP